MSAPDLSAQVQALIEFYFGDANFSKDRFLHKKAQENAEGWVDLNLIMTFNKLKGLTTDPSVVRQAIRASQLVELDPTDQRVRRAVPLPEANKADELTIYVENIPLTSTHDELTTTFGQHGKVTYVSIPKTKEEPRTVKGFAFIEFADAESVIRALHAVPAPSEHNMDHPHMWAISKAEWLRLKNQYKQQLRQARREEQIARKLGLKWNPGEIVRVDNLGPNVTKRSLYETLKQMYPTIEIVHLDLEKYKDYKKREKQQTSADGTSDVSMGMEAATESLVAPSTSSSAPLVPRRAHIRFRNADDAKRVVEEVVGERGLVIEGIPIRMHTLEGEEETMYRQMIADKIRNKRERSQSGKGKDKNKNKDYKGKGKGKAESTGEPEEDAEAGAKRDRQFQHQGKDRKKKKVSLPDSKPQSHIFFAAEEEVDQEEEEEDLRHKGRSSASV
eukprot:TRINITY_DN8264_c1_g1_i1.p1 TRINITY_DN8264_c1_g1~~TRINITY_DN8264_c1_g1_i1.p1  ORF type:complete len:445 (-),score=116.63 TRINITY_DN8264_c1_g1_i1:17-1351(-)